MQKPDRSRPTPDAGPSGSFAADGSWQGFFDHPSATERYVSLLVRSRLASKLSPAQFADTIRSSPHRMAFPSVNLGEWDALTAWAQWPLAPIRSGAEEAVKRCGGGPEGHWSGGAWLSGHHERREGPFVPGATQEIEWIETEGT